MLTCIPDILDWTEIKKIRATVAESEFQDGRKTAGYAKTCPFGPTQFAISTAVCPGPHPKSAAL